jgi:hypothetical protein
MPRWIREGTLLGTQTNVLDSSRTSLIDGATAEEEFQQQLRQAQYELDQLHKAQAVKPRKVVDVDAKGNIYFRDYNRCLDG